MTKQAVNLIKHVYNKLSRSISVLNKAKHEHKSLHMLYCALILPYLHYCVKIWGNTYKSRLSSPPMLQKRAIRIIHNTSDRDYTNSLFKKFTDLVHFQKAQITYKAKNNLLPAIFKK